MSNVYFVRRLSDPDICCTGGVKCPQVWELSSGDIAVIGKDISDETRQILPPDLVIGSDERIVLVPRSVFESTKLA